MSSTWVRSAARKSIMPWGSGSSSAELVAAGIGVTGLVALTGTTVPGGATAGAIDAAGRLGITGRSGFAAGGVRGVFRTTGGGTGEFVLAGALTGLIVTAGLTVLVRPSKARCRASWRTWSLFVPRPAWALSAEPFGGSAGKGGVCAHKLQPARSKDRKSTRL